MFLFPERMNDRMIECDQCCDERYFGVLADRWALIFFAAGLLLATVADKEGAEEDDLAFFGVGGGLGDFVADFLRFCVGGAE